MAARSRHFEMPLMSSHVTGDSGHCAASERERNSVGHRCHGGSWRMIGWLPPENGCCVTTRWTQIMADLFEIAREVNINDVTP